MQREEMTLDLTLLWRHSKIPLTLSHKKLTKFISIHFINMYVSFREYDHTYNCNKAKLTGVYAF